MSSLFDFLKGFLGGGKNNSNSIPFLHEAIDLKSFPTDQVESWISKGGYQEFADLIMEAYRNVLILGKQNSNSKTTTLLDSSHSNGWFLHCDQLDYFDSHYKFLAYELSQRLKDHGYTVQLAEMKSMEKSGGIEMITHYYLKPSLRNRFVQDGNLANQLFGNISIEYKVINDSPKSFKFLAKAYKDSKFLPPNDFSDLNELLFGS